ncbi:hypothetical protein [Rhizobium leguminosarum]|uniref:hypothetical protein n=1 Tax=Rhizobium leguminosarum TaxID=384 RepID=UPI00036F57BB|nr:hypothetical protein [Rhizobium leguminosarum]
MDISFKIHSPWSIGRKAAEIASVNEFSSRGSILEFHSFVMLGGVAQADTSDPDSTIKTEAATKAAARYEFIELSIRTAQILRALMHSITGDLSGLRR